MTDQGQCLAWLNRQAKVFEDSFILVIAEVDMIEANLTAKLRQFGIANLHNFRLGVEQAKDALTGGETKLELAPKRGDAGQWEPEQRQTLDEQVPLPGS